MDGDAEGWRIAAIDGWLGAGKSWLARELSRTGLMWAVDLDAFILRRNGQFIDALAINSLRAAIQANAERTILAGVCVREVLAQLAMEAELHIYVKRMCGWGWTDED